MPVAVTVLYPNVSDATFNLEYYLSTHMPLVEKEFGPHGLKGWKVARILGTATGEAAPYSIQCTLEYNAKEEFEASVKNAAGPVLGDVSNFSNKEPVFLVGEVVGTSK
ncbi:hypothetical protein SLS56_004402 [Neofusicoccum ribis]|uniref:EthD domain-containing protein n=1 Tax=Neofusicoccum ribis TaxID=45134 RepID=A0ABR3SXH8_9PEZI